MHTLRREPLPYVSRAELAAYYEKAGFAPLQFQADPGPGKNPGAGILGGSRPEPSVDAVSQEIFTRLDADGDGKLSREELAAAPAVLLKLDENDDEIITTRELVPNKNLNPNLFAASMMPSNPSAAARATISSRDNCAWPQDPE